MRWIEINEGHHELSHNPDSDKKSQEKLIKINKWYCEQMAYLAKRLAETPEPGGGGSLLDNTLIVWTNELGKGNSHTLERYSLRARRQRPGFPDGPLDQVSRRCRTTGCSGRWPMAWAITSNVRQPQPLRRRRTLSLDLSAAASGGKCALHVPGIVQRRGGAGLPLTVDVPG